MFPALKYKGFVGLTARELKEKAVPFRDAIKETWARLKRAKPEMNTSAMPFVKEKWDELAYYLVQVSTDSRCSESNARGQ